MKLVELVVQKKSTPSTLLDEGSNDEGNQNRHHGQTDDACSHRLSDSTAEASASDGSSHATEGGDGDDGGGEDTTISTGFDWAASRWNRGHRQHPQRPQQLGPGAWHVLPRTTLVRSSWTAEPEAEPAQVEAPGTGEDVVHIVNATLVDDDTIDIGGSGNHTDQQPPISSTLVTHAMSMSEDDSNGAEAPALSLVDQRVVDERISKLKGEHKKTLSQQRSTVVGTALLVLLAIVLVVSISVPLTRPTAVPAPSVNATGTNATGTVELLPEFAICSISSECKVWSDGTGCCTAKYSGGIRECTPLAPWFNHRMNECVVDIIATVAPTPAPNNSKADWAVCSFNGECLSWAEGTGCCTGKYSGGVAKCTPLSQSFNERTNECVSDDATDDTTTGTITSAAPTASSR